MTESHAPERRGRFTPLGDDAFDKPAKAASHDRTPTSSRPIRLLERPEPVEASAEVPEGPPLSFRWRKALYRVARAEGPERIASEWWHENVPAPVRDYFRIEDIEGRRYWLYREGLYGEAAQPRWFLHGIFP